MTIAYGAEWREETFEVISGEEASWKAGKYALQGFNVGSHGFAGFSPDSQGSFTRRSYGLYVDLENQVSDELLLVVLSDMRTTHHLAILMTLN